MPRVALLRLLAAAPALMLAAGAQAQPIGLGSSPQGTATYQLAATVAKEITETLKLQARVQPSSGTGAMIPLVNSGEIDFGFCNSLELYDSFNGVGTFDKRPNPDIRAVAVLYPFVNGIFVRADSPIKSVRDLKGKSIAYGFTSQEIIKTSVDAMLATAGLTIADARPVLVPNLVRGVDELIAGRVDVTPFSPGSAKVTEADAAVGGIRYLDLGNDPAAEAALKKVFKTAYIARVNPAPHLVGVRAPAYMMHFDFTMFANIKVPAERVKAVVAMLVERKDAMAATTPPFRGLKAERLHINYGVPFHDGSLAYFKEKSIKESK